MIYALDDSFRVILLTLMCIEYGFVYIVTKEKRNKIMSKKTSKNGIGCGTIVLILFLICIAISIYSYAWIPAIIATIFFAIKKDRADRKRNLIISSLIGITSLLLFINMNLTPDLTGIKVEWGTTQYTVSDTTQVKITPVPSDAKIDSLEMSENSIAKLDYKDGKAIVSFESEGEDSIFFTANGNVQSDMQKIIVVKENQSDSQEQDNLASKESMTSNLKIHFLDVGQGLSVLIQSDGKNMIYDGGDRSASSFVVSYLKDQNVETIDYLISSHYDEDHLSGLIGCLNAFKVNNVIGSDYEHDSQLYQSFMDAVSSNNLTVQHPSVGDTFNLGSAQFTILSPTNIDTNDSNNNSIAIKITSGKNSFIVTGDAEHGSEADIINTGIDISCDVLCLGHHGSARSTSWDFLQKTVPEFAVISCGTDNQYGHPDADTLDKLSSMEIALFRTDKQGTIIAESDGENINWNLDPCNDYTPGDQQDTGTGVQEETTTATTETQETMVWIPQSGSKYHSNPSCSGMNNPTQVTKSDAESRGYTPCKKCY